MRIAADNVRAIIERYSDMVLKVAYQNTRDLQESEDIVQEVFLALFSRPLPKEEEHLKAWLIRVALNKSRSFLRSARRKVQPLDESLAPAERLAAERSAPEPSFTRDDVLEQLFSLPEAERNALYLHYYEGYSAKEIGKFLKKSKNAVYILLSRGRAKLKELFKEDEDE